MELNAFAPQFIPLSFAQDLEAVDVECDEELLSVVADVQGAAGELCIWLNKDISPGPIESTIKLVGRTSHGELLPEVEVSVVGSVDRDVVVHPAILSFGPVHLGQSKELEVVLLSRSRSSYTAEASSIVGDGLSVSVVAHELRSARHFNVRQESTKVGPQRSQITFRVRENSGAVYSITLPIVHYGTLEIEE